MKIHVAIVIIITIIAQVSIGDMHKRFDERIPFCRWPTIILYIYLYFCADIEIDVFPGWGGSYYPPPAARPEVVIVSPATNYMPLPGGQAMMPQPYNGMSMGGTGYYQQQQGYQYQYQQYNTPPYPQW